MWKFAPRFALIPKLIGVLFLYIALSFILVGSFMRVNDLTIFSKDNWGNQPTKNYIITLPYLTFYMMIVKLYRAFVTDEPIVTKVFDGWYIGGWIDKLEHVKAAGSDGKKVAILDMTTELPRGAFNPGLVYTCLPTFDRSVPHVALIQNAVQWCLHYRSEGYDIVVHCAFGHGRSAAMLIACLLAEGLTGNIDEMEHDLISLRPRVKLTATQFATLVAWARKAPQLPFPNAPYITEFVKKAFEEERLALEAEKEKQKQEAVAEAATPASIEEVDEDVDEVIITGETSSKVVEKENESTVEAETEIAADMADAQIEAKVDNTNEEQDESKTENEANRAEADVESQASVAEAEIEALADLEEAQVEAEADSIPATSALSDVD